MPSFLLFTPAGGDTILKKQCGKPQSLYYLVIYRRNDTKSKNDDESNDDEKKNSVKAKKKNYIGIK